MRQLTLHAPGATWHIAMRPDKRRAMDKQSPPGATLDRTEQLKSSSRAEVEHPFQVIKRQLSLTKVRCRGLVKNTDLDPVHALESVDGEQTIYANHFMSASNYRQEAGIDRQREWISRQEAVVTSEFAPIVFSSEIHRGKLALTVNS